MFEAKVGWAARLGAGAACGLLCSAAALAQAPAPAPATTAPVAQQPAPAPAPGQIAAGVGIAGVDVSGMTAAAARAAVIAGHVAPRRQPVVVVFRGKRVPINPVAVGYRADVDYAVRAAMLFGRSRPVPAEGVDVALREAVNLRKLRAQLKARVARFSVPAVDAAFSLRGTKPVVREARPGIALDENRAVVLVRDAVIERRRNQVPVPSTRVKPTVTRLPSAIIIDRSNFRLTFWRHKGRSVTFPVAVGTSSHPTPSGNFRVIQKQMHPTWYPPNSPWAAGMGPVPPGVGNPLGTRWIGISSPAIGMHGTPVPSSIGTRASHGCIRMYMRDVERLYTMVSIDTPVYIR